MSTTTDTPAVTGTYAIDPIHSSLGFAVRYQGAARYRNRFTSATGSLDERDGRLHLTGVTSVESIDIHTPQAFRDHVLAADFFDAAAHPDIRFESDDVRLIEGQATVIGTLTIKGNALPITAVGTYEGPYDTGRGDGLVLSLRTSIDRREAGIHWQMQLPGDRLAVAWDVELEIELALASVEG